MANSEINYKSIFYPPGGVLIWILIFLELVTFGGALIAMTVLSKSNQELFHASKLLLNINYGSINTLVLLTSGFFIATAVHLFKQSNFKKSARFVLLAIVFGLLFIVIKTLEYAHKIDAGITLEFNTFFTFYWLLTGFHLIHVMVGLFILTVFYFSLIQKDVVLKAEDFEAGAAFWHMCDLIWLVLFPVIYLFF